MGKYDSIDVTGNDELFNKVIHHQQKQVDRLQEENDRQSQALDAVIGSSEALLRQLGITPKQPKSAPVPGKIAVVQRSFDEIAQEALNDEPDFVSLSEIVTPEQIKKAEQDVQDIYDRFELEHTLDALDWGIAGIAGVLAALVDIFLVKMPQCKLTGHEGGKLSNFIKDKLKNMYSPQEQRTLEDEFSVPYDPSTSKGLKIPVPGLGPRTHRFQSLGHDPILGFFYGVRDIMRGQFTAIDKTGKIITQGIPGAEQGIGLFSAILKQIGHLKSDVGTAAGLPAPFMPLLQLLQFGNIDGRTVGELSRLMYAQGYDFGHFLAMGIPVIMIEIIVRGLYFAKRLNEGHSIMDSIPFDAFRKTKLPKLQTMLFTAHTIATAFNAGKAFFMHNPLALNLPQWQIFALYSYRQLKWLLFEKPAEQNALVQDMLDGHWDKINDSLLQNWTIVTA